MPAAENPVLANDKIPKDLRHKSRARLVWVAVSGSTNNALLTSIVPLFLLSLGASPFLIALVATSNHIQKMGRIIGLQYMHRTGKAGIFIWGRIGSAPFGLALAILAYWGGAGLWAAWIGLLLFSLRGTLQQIGNTAWWPLVQDNTDGGAIGSYLAHMRLRQRLLELILPLGVGWYLGAQPNSEHFALPFALAIFSTVAGAIAVRGIGEKTQAPPAEGLTRRLYQVLNTPPMRSYSFFVVARMGIMAATQPLWVVVLTGHGLPVSYFVWMTPVTALGYMVGLHAWGHLVDQHGPRAPLSITLTLQALLALAWLVLPASPLHIALWASAVYFVWGALEGGQQMGQSRAMLDAVGKENQAEGFALAIYASAVGGVAGGALGGAFFQWAQGPEWELYYLAAAQVGLLGPWLLSTRLSGYGQQTSVWQLFKRSTH
ncbi:MAG: hypothetical protein ACI906_004570 [Candidatus Latescibacterota bacterium]|jgi:hypothetical protein